MKIPVYQVDAFTNRPFTGNPAAICPLERWPDDALLQAIAAENNLSETAFFVREESGLRIRWFTPTAEVDLCGHATLAAALIYLTYFEPEAEQVTFDSRSGVLPVTRHGGRLCLDFPALPPTPITAPPLIAEALGVEVLEAGAADDWLVVVENEATVRRLAPDMALLRRLDRRGVIVTAPGSDCDFVSRFFAPRYGIDEDPVTGSAHCTLAPYWAARLGKRELHARQVSRRGGELICRLRGDRVELEGDAVEVMRGTFVGC